MRYYKYALVDMSYLMTRNLFAASAGRGIGEYHPGDVMRITLQTINKLSRDYGVYFEKCIFLLDRWDKELGGYYRTSLLKDFVKYKGSRVYVDEKYLDELKNKPGVTEEEIRKAEKELYFNNVKYNSKWGMVRDFGRIGIPSIGIEGWECDDLAWLASCMLAGSGAKEKSVIITKDSDQKYSLSPAVDYLKLGTKGADPTIITYDEMYWTIPGPLRENGVGLYEYKSYLDSLGEGHNDMKSTKKKGGKDIVESILKIRRGDYSELEDVEAFKIQMKSFDLSHFPRLEEAKKAIMSLGSIGKVGDGLEFLDVCGKYDIGLTEEFYNQFSSRLNTKLYTQNG